MKMIRASIKLFADQYNFYKELKSKRLLIAFVEFMFEDIEPKWLNWIEKVAFDSLRIRMENQRKKACAWSKWWSISRWWWRHSNTDSNTAWELGTENKQKTSKKQAKEQTKNNQEEDNISKDILLKEEVEVREDWKRKHYENVRLKDTELKKLNDEYWEKIIEEYILKLSEYITRHWDRYVDHNLTIRKRLLRWGIKKRAERIKEQDKPYDFDKKPLYRPKLPWITNLKKDC